MKSMEKLIVRIVMLFFAAIPTCLFYNNSLAWNFNLPTFSYWEIVLGLLSGYMMKALFFHSISDD